MSEMEQEPQLKMPLPGDKDWNHELWRLRAIEVMEGREFGWYCHEGGDLTRDVADRFGRTLDGLYVDDVGELERFFEDIVEELEAANCGFCTEEAGEGDDDSYGVDDESETEECDDEPETPDATMLILRKMASVGFQDTTTEQGGNDG